MKIEITEAHWMGEDEVWVIGPINSILIYTKTGEFKEMSNAKIEQQVHDVLSDNKDIRVQSQDPDA